jgi:hypothetical protein
MANRTTIEELGQQVAQLPPSEQLKLVARICVQLSAKPLITSTGESGEEQALQERVVQAEALLAELDAIAESIEGVFDSAEDIRQIREERASRL